MSHRYWWEHSTDEPLGQPGCIVGRMQRDSCHGLAFASAHTISADAVPPRQSGPAKQFPQLRWPLPRPSNYRVPGCPTAQAPYHGARPAKLLRKLRAIASSTIDANRLPSVRNVTQRQPIPGRPVSLASLTVRQRIPCPSHAQVRQRGQWKITRYRVIATVPSVAPLQYACPMLWRLNRQPCPRTNLAVTPSGNSSFAVLVRILADTLSAATSAVAWPVAEDPSALLRNGKSQDPPSTRSRSCATSALPCRKLS